MRSPASRAHSRPPRFLAALFLALSHFSLADVTVSSLAGGGADGTSFGTVDGAGTSVGFYQPNGIALHGDGNLSIADTGNYKIRALSPRGIVTTIAGGGADGESKGVADGFGTSAGFNLPAAVVADPASNRLVVADTYNHKISVIDAAGLVSTLAGGGADGNTKGSADGTGTSAGFCLPGGVVADSAGRLFVTDACNFKVRVVSPAGVVTTLAGGGADGSTSGWANGVGTSAGFAAPQGIALSATGVLFIVDYSSHNVRAITPLGVVSTLVGGGQRGNSSGSTNGVGTNALFFNPLGIAVGPTGTVYITDYGNNRVCAVVDGVVSTLAGSGAPAGYGAADGAGSSATFNAPAGLAVDGAGRIYVSDAFNHKVRTIAPVLAAPAPPAAPNGPLIAGSVAAAATLAALAVCARQRLTATAVANDEAEDPGAAAQQRELIVVPNPLRGAADVGDPCDGAGDKTALDFSYGGWRGGETAPPDGAAPRKIMIGWGGETATLDRRHGASQGDGRVGRPELGPPR